MDFTVQNENGFAHVYRSCPNPMTPGETVVCSVSMFNNEIIDWSAYVGTGTPDNKENVMHIAEWGGKISERDARHLFPDQTGRYRS